jgi:hypothetical protein
MSNEKLTPDERKEVKKVEVIQTLLGLGHHPSLDKDDPRWKFSPGDIVLIKCETVRGAGRTCKILNRRNAYPGEMWCPIYFLEGIDGKPGPGELGEGTIRLATEEEIKVAREDK